MILNTKGLQRGENEYLRLKNDIAGKSYGVMRTLLLVEEEREGVA